LKSEVFLGELRELDPELIVVVAFRMLPEEVWTYPAKGTINLHASMLPHYRGAAPINRAIMNGETQTGLSTFFIEKDIDTGKIILQEAVEIGPEDTAGSLHDRMMIRGARLLTQTVRAIGQGNYPTLTQSDLMKPGETLKTAPKIHPEDCRIPWNKPVRVVYNLVRGLSPHPCAWTILVSPDGKEKTLKVFSAIKLERKTAYNPGTLMTDGKSILEVVCRNGMIKLKEVQLEGKKKMKIEDFLKGLKNASNYTVK
jgi:methionyl-tRNA formyltransferase